MTQAWRCASENGDREPSAAATLGQVLPNMTTNDADAQERTDRERVRAALRAAGYRPHEVDAQLAFAQTHLRDWSSRGGAA